MKTISEQDLSAMLAQIYRVYENNNSATLKLMEMVENIKGAKKRLYTQKEMLDTANLSLELCKIIHAMSEHAENALIKAAPTIMFASDIASGVQQASPATGE